MSEWSRLERILRETERDIAADPEAYGTTAEEWERVRQYPGEQRKGKHVHVAERCEHGETKWTCEHKLPWDRYRVRSVPCAPSFCLWANESDGDGRTQQGQG